MARTTIRYPDYLVEQARKGVRWSRTRIAEDGRIVPEWISASVLQRRADGVALNDREGETFAFLEANPHFLELIGERTIALIEAGRTEYSVHHVLGSLRYENDIKINAISKFEIDDHYGPTLGRMLNEMMGVGFYTARNVEGEPKVDQYGVLKEAS